MNIKLETSKDTSLILKGIAVILFTALWFIREIVLTPYINKIFILNGSSIYLRKYLL